MKTVKGQPSTVQQEKSFGETAAGAVSRNAAKHEAAYVALVAIGGRGRIPDMVKWLRDRGYGSKLEVRVLHNSIFAAMTRHPETFERIEEEKGAWRIASQAADNKSSVQENEKKP